MGNWSSSHWGVLGNKVEHIPELILLRGRETGVVILKLDYQHLCSSDFSPFKAFGFVGSFLSFFLTLFYIFFDFSLSLPSGTHYFLMKF